MSPDLTVIVGDALGKLRELPSESVHCCVTSPPYWGLRDYGTAQWEGGDATCEHIEKFCRNDGDRQDSDGFAGNSNSQGHAHMGKKQFRETCGKCGAKRIDLQLGLEKTPEEYVAKMVEVFREVRRVLRKDGTLWLNLGDSYAGGGTSAASNSEHDGGVWKSDGFSDGFRNSSKYQGQPKQSTAVSGLKPKDLCGIPWRVAFALQADGWYLRSDIIWSKPNPMPESATDRPTKSHEYMFLLTKSARYFYDAEAIKESGSGRTPGNRNYKYDGLQGHETKWGILAQADIPQNDRNKRSVWTVATAPYPEAHFATYPPDLIKPCILAGTSAKGCCAKCGAPWGRIVEKHFVPQQDVSIERGIKGTEGQKPMDASNGWQGVPRGSNDTKTIGWQRTCKCVYHAECKLSTGRDIPPKISPCTVLDPFAGSGTTGAVALELGRSAVLIELSSNYAQLIRERCAITPGLALS